MIAFILLIVISEINICYVTYLKIIQYIYIDIKMRIELKISKKYL